MIKLNLRRDFVRVRNEREINISFSYVYFRSIDSSNFIKFVCRVSLLGRWKKKIKNSSLTRKQNGNVHEDLQMILMSNVRWFFL